MTEKRFTGIQKTVLQVVEESCKSSLPFIKKKYILDRVMEIRTDFDKLDKEAIDVKISQALYHLQKNTKYRRPRIRKFFDKQGHQLGWTLTSEDKSYRLDMLPDTFSKLQQRISIKEKRSMRCIECNGLVIKKRSPYIYKGIHLGFHQSEHCPQCGTIYFPEDSLQEIFEQAKRLGLIHGCETLQELNH